ncbi:hypothetical protein [Rhodopseudomonas boonkerdii]|nr:hypothetical protein [Rhodopseudomonas boonkerdii]
MYIGDDRLKNAAGKIVAAAPERVDVMIANVDVGDFAAICY